jgi:hypothetical protein
MDRQPWASSKTGFDGPVSPKIFGMGPQALSDFLWAKRTLAALLARLLKGIKEGRPL